MGNRPFYKHSLIPLLSACTVLSFSSVAIAQTSSTKQAPRPLMTVTNGIEKRFVSSSDQVRLTRSTDAATPGVNVTIQPGKDDYPGVALKPEGAAWNLSTFGHVEARLVNTGSKPLTLALRVDNAGDWKDNPWNTEAVTLAPGETQNLKVIFGHAYGYKPAYALKPNAVVQLLLFAGKSDDVQRFRIESLTAAGPAGEKPPIAPEAVRKVPQNGIILGAGARTHPPASLSVEGAKSVLTGDGLHVTFPSSPGESIVTVRPDLGRWDLRDFLQVQVTVQNSGKAPVTPRVRLETNGGPTPWVTSTSPLSPGQAQTLTIPFLPATPIDLDKPETLPKLSSDAVSGVQVAVGSGDTERILIVSSIATSVPRTHVPDWLGKRPPVPGDWVPTLRDEFNGTTLNKAIWDDEGENYYDKTTHWSKNNVLIGGGLARLRYAKKTGYHNDDPKRNQTDYAAGFLNSYGKWTQRYGYFEARMKLPKAPGLWPAFWMMPDRGVSGGEQWKRQFTGDGGMEFDIMEALTRWGPFRYNIAIHYDGYDKEHKAFGSDRVYFKPDKDGFVTSGLLWTPGLAVFYCNGREVLRWENPRISTVPSCLMFTLPSGGWDNNAVDDAKLPADFVIDYVRVWQRKDLASAADSKPIGIGGVTR